MTYTRVERWSVVQTDSTPEFYDVTLTLSTNGRLGVGGTGGGSTQPFPPVAPGTPGTLEQYATGAASVGLPTSAPADGNLLLCWMTERGLGTYPGTPAGWTSIATARNEIGTGGNYHARLVYKIASGDSQTVIIFGTANIIGTAMEWSGVTLGAHVAQSDLISATFTAGGAITPSAPNAVVVGCGVVGTFFGSSVTPDAGVTEIAEAPFGGGNMPINWVGYKAVASQASTIVGGTLTGEQQFGGVTVALLPSSTTEPPMTGQPVLNETPTPDPGGGNTLFYTLNPYAPGSLRVLVDDIDQTAAVTETDPQTGAFTLAFDPRSWELVRVSYIGA